MCRRDFEAVVLRDIRKAERAGADPVLCTAARQLLREYDQMYRHKVSGLSRLAPGARRECRERCMSRYINCVDAVGDLVRTYADRRCGKAVR